MNNDARERNRILQGCLDIAPRTTDHASLARRLGLHPAAVKRHLRYIVENHPRYLVVVTHRDDFIIEMPDGAVDEVRNFLAHGGFSRLTAEAIREKQRQEKRQAMQDEQLALAIKESKLAIAAADRAESDAKRARHSARVANIIAILSLLVAAAALIIDALTHE